MNLKAKAEELRADARELRAMATPKVHFQVRTQLNVAAQRLEDAAAALDLAVGLALDLATS